jgi:tripartite-type tricarboxylate transporter receptor subunit TctC
MRDYPLSSSAERAAQPASESRRDFLAHSLGLALGGIVGPSQAQSIGNFPERPITLICPWSPGGPTDVAVRALGDAFSRALGNKRVIIDSKPGAGGALGGQYIAQHGKPDGYLLSQIPLGVFRLPYLTKTNFNPVTDLSYIICVAGYNFGLTVRADSPWKTWKEFIAEAKAKPGHIRYGSPGVGTSLHVTMEDIAQREGTKFVHVPYKGTAQTTAALLGNEVDLIVGTPPWGLLEGGKIRILSTWSSERTPQTPDVPTLKEIYGIVANSPWGIAGPKGMAPELVKFLHDTFRKAMDDRTYVTMLEKVGMSPFYMSSDAFLDFARKSFAAEKEVVERLGLAKTTG